MTLLVGDALEMLRTLPDGSVHCCVTSPPYWGLRDYGVEGQLGLEPTPDLYVARLVEVFSEVRRVLRDDGTLWLNLGDSYVSVGDGRQGDNGQMDDRAVVRARLQVRDAKAAAGMGAPMRPFSVGGLRPKNLVGIPWRVAFALQGDGWYLRSDIIWSKPNPMPESVTDRPTKAHEYLFLLSKNERYHYDAAAIAEPAVHAGRVVVYDGSQKNCSAGDTLIDRTITVGTTRNARTVWTIPTQPNPEAHFATFPKELARRCILAGCPLGGTVLDPFAGTATAGVVAIEQGRQFIGIELNPQYVLIAQRYLDWQWKQGQPDSEQPLLFAEAP